MYTKKKSIFVRMSENAKVQKAFSILLPVILGIVIFILWQTQVIHKLFHVDVFTLPVPVRIITIMGDNLPAIMENTRATVFVAVVGLGIGSVIGYIIAWTADRWRGFGRGGLIIVTAFNAIPIVALAPVMSNWTRDVSTDANVRSMAAKILVVMIVSIAAMSINAYRGLTELKPYAMDMMVSYAAKRRDIFWKLQFPNSIPYVFTALKVSAPNSVISAIVAEYFAEYIIGVGRQIRENIVLAQYSTAWAYILTACIIGIVFYAVLMAAEAVILRHRK